MQTPTLQASRKTKKTQVGELPVDWIVTKLDHIAIVQTGLAKGKKGINEPVSLPYLRVANVQDGFFDLREVKTITVERSEMERYSLRANDVLLTEGGDLDKLGRGHLWEGQIEPCLHQNHVFVVRTKIDALLPLFFALQTAGPHGCKYFLSCAKRTTNLASINATQLKHFPVVLPPLAEQRDIVIVIGRWDCGIKYVEKLLGAKQELNKGLMLQLLTGRRRFKEFKSHPWQMFRLGELFTERLETGRENLPLVSITAQSGIVSRESLAKRDTSSEDKSKYPRIAPGDIGYNTMRMWQGVSGLSKLEGIVSPAYTICVPSKRIDGQFAAYLFKHAPVVNLFRRYSQGLVDDTLALKFPNFAQIHVSIPEIEEQRRIAAVLEACDREIELLQKQLDALKQQKRGLMLKLLTGELRVKF